MALCQHSNALAQGHVRNGAHTLYPREYALESAFLKVQAAITLNQDSFSAVIDSDVALLERALKNLIIHPCCRIIMPVIPKIGITKNCKNAFLTTLWTAPLDVNALH